MKENISKTIKIEKIKKFKNSENCYYLKTQNEEYVLKKSQNSQQTQNEYSTLKRLQLESFPSPKVYCVCLDEKHVGFYFFIMKFVSGRIFGNPYLPNLTSNERFSIYNSIITEISKLHHIEVDNEKNIILEELDGFNKKTNQKIVKEIVEKLNIKFRMIKDYQNSIVHNNLKFENIIFDPLEPKIISIINWKQSKVSNSLSDISDFCSIYQLSQNKEFQGLYKLNIIELGIPKEKNLLEKYLILTNRKTISINFWNMMKSYSFLKIAIKIPEKEIFKSVMYQKVVSLSLKYINSEGSMKEKDEIEVYEKINYDNKIFNRLPFNFSEKFKKYFKIIWNFLHFEIFNTKMNKK
jgi:aminoglycoside phosphotransferase (APT) family kinase protein